MHTTRTHYLFWWLVQHFYTHFNICLHISLYIRESDYMHVVSQFLFLLFSIWSSIVLAIEERSIWLPTAKLNKTIIISKKYSLIEILIKTIDISMMNLLTRSESAIVSAISSFRSEVMWFSLNWWFSLKTFSPSSVLRSFLKIYRASSIFEFVWKEVTRDSYKYWKELKVWHYIRNISTTVKLNWTLCGSACYMGHAKSSILTFLFVPIHTRDSISNTIDI